VTGTRPRLTASAATHYKASRKCLRRIGLSFANILAGYEINRIAVPPASSLLQPLSVFRFVSLCSECSLVSVVRAEVYSSAISRYGNKTSC
jgi:hypothetical protein